MVAHVNKLLINSVSCVNAAAQFAGIAALDGPDDSIKDMLDKFTLRRNLIHKGLNDLPGIECSLPGGAFYAFPKAVPGTIATPASCIALLQNSLPSIPVPITLGNA